MSTFSNRTLVRTVAAALAAATLLLAGACTSPSTDGPLMVGENKAISGGSWDVGTTISFGAPKVRNPTDATMTVSKITPRLADKDSGLKITAIYIVDLSNPHETSGLAIGFPPANQSSDTFVPAEGATLGANRWFQVLFVAHVDKLGKWAMPSFDVTYTANGKKYVATVWDGLQLCAPSGVLCQG